jgi:acyl dehydratase
MTDVCLEHISEGTRFESGRRTLTETDIVSFSAITGDYSPLHADLEYIRRNTEFRDRIAQGWLLVAIQSGLSSALKSWRILAYMGMDRRFIDPVYPGDTLHTSYEVESVRPSAGRPTGGVVQLRCEVLNQHGVAVCTGRETFFVARSDA